MEPASVLPGRPLVFHRVQRGSSAIRTAVTKGRDSRRYEGMDPAGFGRRVCERIAASRVHGGGEIEVFFFCIDTLWLLLSLYTYCDLILSFNLPCLMRCKVSDQWTFLFLTLIVSLEVTLPATHA